MSHGIRSLSTAGIPEGLRADFWSNALSALFGDIRLDPIGSEPFDAKVEYLELPGVHLSCLQGSSVRVEALPSSCQSRDVAFRVLFQTEGTAIFEQGSCKIQFGPGDCLIYDFSQPHRLTNIGQTKAHSVTVPKRLLTGRGLTLERMPARRSRSNPIVSIVHDFLGSVLRSGETVSTDAATGIADATLNLLLAGFRREETETASCSQAEALMRRVRLYVLDHLGDPGLNIGRIACAMGCSERYLHMVFREEQTSITRLIWQLRIERCREELEQASSAGRSITEVAFSWGFSSSAHFSRLFKERFGMSPSQVRGGHGAAIQ